jgi:phospholipase/carboxylesterase
MLSEMQIQNHRCLVIDPPMIPPNAPVVLVLHGLGTNGDDLAPICNELQLPPCRFVLPDAPLSLRGYPPGAFAWYDFEVHDYYEIKQSREYLFKVMERFANDPNLLPAPGSAREPKSFILAGFSQGGLMALEAGLNYEGKILAIVSMSGYMPYPKQTLQKAKASFETPILLVHGIEDPLVPVQWSRETHQALQQGGYHPVRQEYHMEHTISEDSLSEVSRFLREALGYNK